MFTKANLSKIALAGGLGAALLSGVSTASLAATPKANHAASAAHAQAVTHSAGTRSAMSARQAQPRQSVGPFYYEGDDNGTVWSYYPGYKPLR